ncbi:MAG TPA: DUF420 domain-containing protein [Bacillus sp. (in: firmicutes)]|uniref:DUF420 domain-containing protein n=1 Tax=Bacillus litorisediminis TaxID=2922713 RepID=UPI001FB02445|nr:DUF420 domain-containing protein [Bacillus litorisediminis]HWO77157.1 DUF420 domain-containing protein [Bacillus sp. (in: firmicutes)]
MMEFMKPLQKDLLYDIVDIFPLLSTICIIISAILVAFGWYLIINGKKMAHKQAMISAAYLAILFFVIYTTRTILIGNTTFGGPDHLKPYYTSFLIFHIFLAVTGVGFGTVTIRYASKGQVKKHKKLGPLASVIWFFSATTGLCVYLILYVIWGSGPVKSMIHAIL